MNKTINIKVSISGITCDACIRLITRRVSAIQGVSQVEVDRSGETSIIAARDIPRGEIIEVLQGTNYTVL